MPDYSYFCNRMQRGKYYAQSAENTYSKVQALEQQGICRFQQPESVRERGRGDFRHIEAGHKEVPQYDIRLHGAFPFLRREA